MNSAQEETIYVTGSQEHRCQNKYDRVIYDKYSGEPVVVDVYSVLEAFGVKCPALSHLTKKSLCAGLRGHKDETEDLQDILDSAVRAKQLGENRAHR